RPSARGRCARSGSKLTAGAPRWPRGAAWIGRNAGTTWRDRSALLWPSSPSRGAGCVGCATPARCSSPRPAARSSSGSSTYPSRNEGRMNRIHANGLEFAYLEEGDGPLVLILHGFPDNARSWSHQMRALAAAGYRAVAPYLRGYPPSEVVRDGFYDKGTL